MTNNFFYIAQYFTPEPYLKDIQFIKDIKGKGWEPVVITGFPNYPKGIIYKGYSNKFFAEEMMDGVRVIRVYTYADHSLNAFKRALNYFVFALFASIAIFKFGKKESFYYILQSSPFVVLCAWTVNVCKKKSKTLLDIQDVFPENIRISGYVKSTWIISLLDFFLNNFYYKSFDLFVTVSESFRNIIAKKNIGLRRILTLYNWSMVEKSSAAPSVIDFSFPNSGINIVYAGNIGVHQGISTLFQGMFNVIENNPKIHFHLFGDGTDFEILKSLVKQNENIILHGRVSTTEIGKYLEAADVLFLHLIKDPIYESIIPSKLQAYIEVGKPILGGVEGEARNLITENRLGQVFEPQNIIDFQNAALKISDLKIDDIREIKQRSAKLYSEKFSRKAGIDRLEKFIKNYL
ncbi:hypothetical protein NBC122_00350 [Chryseobacterium salivictor]|uniref:Uncharacterized protein n=1 Tax=Chryseobacterium salivictor TaxID=2547600 RepID=A0A4P6ZCR7_9FLAO|nr:hypothetical protein NBC122_00350 [Chryseobacterium salivictor]